MTGWATDDLDQIAGAYRTKYRQYGARYANPTWPLRREPRRSN
jgi:hypothetical protein